MRQYLRNCKQVEHLNIFWEKAINETIKYCKIKDEATSWLITALALIDKWYGNKQIQKYKIFFDPSKEMQIIKGYEFNVTSFCEYVK